MRRIKYMLDQLQLDEKIEFFHDGDIQASQLWNEEIESHLREATHILLAISDAYVTSHYVRTVELPAIKNKVEMGGISVFPLLIGGENWPIFLDSDRASFLKSRQWWPMVGGKRMAFSGLSVDAQNHEISALRRQILSAGGGGDEPIIPGAWWGGDEDVFRHQLTTVQVPDTVAISTLNEELPYYLSNHLQSSEVPAIVRHTNDFLFELDRSSFAKRKIPEPPINLVGQEAPYWAGVLSDLADKSALSILVLLVFIYPRAPAVAASIERILAYRGSRS
ncbi:TIR domain-containing protein [Bradyrhizobium sp. Pha-3]|uniref:TIR domain-containing protein n=1 Tax=Bradyrhizobium sp. Pha-3 TaxID=208375 RepID=UPI0035D4DD12